MRHSSGKLTIDLQALRDNYNIIKEQLAPGCRSAAVVKADGYGLGADIVAGELIKEGCDTFFVAQVDEAVSLRAAYPDIKIHVLGGYFDASADLYLEHNLIPVIGSFPELEEYKKLAEAQSRALPAFLHFDTQMNRLGFDQPEAQRIIGDLSILEGLDVQGVMSHFACADEAGHEMNDMQYEAFKNIAQYFPNAQKSLANSSGIFRSEKYHFDLARPGMALYGLNPTPEKDSPMKRVVTLEVPVIRTRSVQKGEPVGYSATYRFDKETQIATVSAGYADGLHRAGSNNAVLYWQGHACPIRGRVSMDLISVDLGGVSEAEHPKPGDYFEVLGPHQSPAEFGAACESFDYEVMTSLGGRYQRHYVDG